jgi:hypothetical protein
MLKGSSAPEHLGVFLPWAPWRIQGFLLPGRRCRVLQWCVCSFMKVLGHEYNPHQWRLFIHSSKVVLKLVLLHNGNRFPSVPLAHAANMKESYHSMELLMWTIKYDEFKWKLCGDLKLATLLLGLQHKIVLFPVRVGQLGQEESLCK